MSFELFTAIRYLRAKKKSAFTSLITGISIGGVMLGVTALIVVLSVMNGFADDLKSKILGTNAHAVVLKYGTNFREYDEVLQKVKKVSDVVAASPFILNEVMISSENNLSGVLIKGIDPKTTGKVTKLSDNIIHGSLSNLTNPDKIPQTKQFLLPDDEIEDNNEESKKKVEAKLPGIVIGKELAEGLLVGVGSVVNVVSPLGDMGPTGPIPKSKGFRVAGVFYSGMYEYDTKFVYIHLKEAQNFFSMHGKVSGIELKVKDIYKTKKIKNEIVNILGGTPYKVKDWQEMNRNLFSALKLEKIVMGIILLFIVLVASFNIVSTLFMIVIEKGKEIAILKAMGATNSSIMKIFVIMGIIIGSIGTSMGLIVGYGICIIVEKYGIKLDPEVYYIASLPVKINLIEFITVSLAALFISFFATIYPSLKAAHLSPVEGLRYE